MERRVDIKLEEDTLRWAGIEAAKLGISRRKYISNVVTRIKFLQTELTGKLEFIHNYPGGNLIVPFSFDNPVVEYGDGDLTFVPSFSQRLKIWERKS